MSFFCNSSNREAVVSFKFKLFALSFVTLAVILGSSSAYGTGLPFQEREDDKNKLSLVERENNTLKTKVKSHIENLRQTKYKPSPSTDLPLLSSAYYPRKIPSSPSMEAFFKHGFLVHVGILPLHTFDKASPWDLSIQPGGEKQSKCFSYWTFGGVVPIDTFSAFNYSNAAVIIPIASVLN